MSRLEAYSHSSARVRTLLRMHPAQQFPQRFVYFIQAEQGGPIKIGVCRDPHARLASLQTCNPLKLRILGVVEGVEKDERRLHRRFAATRLQGEWFEPSGELLEYVAIHAGPVPWLRPVIRRSPWPDCENCGVVLDDDSGDTYCGPCREYMEHPEFWDEAA